MLFWAGKQHMTLKNKWRLMLAGLVTIFAFGAAGSAEAAHSPHHKQAKKTAHHKVVKVKKAAHKHKAAPARKAAPLAAEKPATALQRLGTYACIMQEGHCIEEKGYNVNGHALIEPASLNKIMTVNLLEKHRRAEGKDLNDYCLTITQNDRLKGMKGERGGKWSYMGGGVLKTAEIGTRLTYQEAIYALSVKSANDVAVAVARVVAGSEDAFAVLMTEEAKHYGALKTVFKNASGMPQTGQVSTAYDMAQIFAGMTREFDETTMRDIFGQRAARIGGHTIPTHIPDLRSGRVVAAKTGTLSGVSNIVAIGQNKVIAVVMGASNGAARSAELAHVLGITQVATIKTAPKPRAVVAATGPAV